MNGKITIKNYHIAIVFLFLGFVYMTFYICHTNMDKYQQSIALLPLVYFIGASIIFLLKENAQSNFAILIMETAFFIKLVIYPIFVIIGGISVKGTYGVVENIDKAVTLQGYEYIVCMMATLFFGRKEYKKSNDEINVIRFNKIWIWISIIIAFLGILKYPLILGKFKLLFSADPMYSIKWQRNLNYIKNILSPFVYYLFSWYLVIIRIIIEYSLLIFLKSASKRINERICLGLSVISLLWLVIYTSDDRAGSIFSVVAFLMLIIKLYPKYKRSLYKTLVIAVCVFAVGVLFILPVIRLSKYQSADSGYIFQYMNYHINAYFGGTINVSACFEMPSFEFQILLGDIVHNIPIVGGAFPELESTTILFNDAIGIDIYNSQIIPTVGQGLYYLGPIFAPVFSVILIKMGFRRYNRTRNSLNSWQYYICMYSVLFCFLGVSTYNLGLVIYLLIMYIVPLKIIGSVFTRINIKV